MCGTSSRRRVPSRRAIIFQLPTELISSIIEALYEDDVDDLGTRRSLIACSEVCTRLRLITLPFLFHTITFNIRASFEEDGYCQDRSLRCRTAESFRRLVEAYAAVRENIQEVRVFAGRCHTHRAGYVDPPELTSILPLLPKLRVVKLHDFFFLRDALALRNEQFWQSFPTPVSNRPSIELLHLSFDRYNQTPIDLALLLLLISSFSNVGTMSIAGAKLFRRASYWTMEEALGRLAFESFSKVTIRAFEAESASGVDGLLPILRYHLRDGVHLETLRLGTCTFQDRSMELLSEFIRSSADSLLDVSTYLYGLERGASFFEALEGCRKLQKLSLELVWWDPHCLETLNVLLTSVRHLPRLNAVTFVVVDQKPWDNVFGPGSKAAEYFAPLEASLLHLPALKRIIFKVCEDVVLNEAEFEASYRAFESETIPSLVPTLHSRGMLEVSQEVKFWARDILPPDER